MAKNYFNRYVWLIDTINRNGYITMSEISRLWQHSALNELGEPLAERTFHHHKEAILDIFGIEIRNDRNQGYYIEGTRDIERDSIRQWLLESMSLNNLLNESFDMRERILFEPIPSSQKWITVLVNAMKEGHAIEMTYQSFWRTEPNTFMAHPYCLKLFRQRWYLLALSENYDMPRIYALDRVLNIITLEKPLEMSDDFNAASFFAPYYGIIIQQDKEEETVRIKVDSDQVKYYTTLPLHHSQQIVESTPDYTIFEYRITPTFDFKQELLSRGPSVEVLSPQWFRDEIRSDAEEMLKRYLDPH